MRPAAEESRTAGFATLEILVAFLVLALGLTAMVGTILVARRNIDRAREDATAVAAMQSFMAEDMARVLSEAGGATFRARGPGWTADVEPIEGAPMVALRLLIANEKAPDHPFRFLTFKPSPKAEEP